jgi:hypothetical protein
MVFCLISDSLPIRYIRMHPFSTMALCNIVGDLGYLGFAFDADGFVSLPKLIGASFTMSAHIILLAYGDDQARRIAGEEGLLSRTVLKLRAWAKNIAGHMPEAIQKRIRANPVGIAFLMLSINGLGLFLDAWLRLQGEESFAMLIQVVMGPLITLGTIAFAIAGFARSQKAANILTKVAPSVLVGASVANVGLAMTTGNVFVMISVVAFIVSNLAGFYTRLNKKQPISAGI